MGDTRYVGNKTSLISSRVLPIFSERGKKGKKNVIAALPLPTATTLYTLARNNAQTPHARAPRLACNYTRHDAIRQHPFAGHLSSRRATPRTRRRHRHGRDAHDGVAARFSTPLSRDGRRRRAVSVVVAVGVDAARRGRRGGHGRPAAVRAAGRRRRWFHCHPEQETVHGFR